MAPVPLHLRGDQRISHANLEERPRAASGGAHLREKLGPYREWRPASGYEGSASIGGSFSSENIEDYYFTPWDLSYGHLVKFDHDFIGCEALERMADGPHRTKVTLALDDDGAAQTIAAMFRKESCAKFMDWPSAVYSMHPFENVTVGGQTIGASTWISYTLTRATYSPLRSSTPSTPRPAATSPAYRQGGLVEVLKQAGNRRLRFRSHRGRYVRGRRTQAAA